MITSTPVPLYYETAGDDRRPALLLLNPLGTTIAVWDPMMETLVKHHFVIRFDIRGHGQSVGPVKPYRIEDLANDALAVLDALEIPRTHVFGASLGGLVAIWLGAMHRKRVDRLVIASTGTQLGPDEWWKQTVAQIESGGLEAVADHLERRVFFSKLCQEQAGDICAASREMLLATPKEAYLAGAHAILRANLAWKAKQVRASTLVIFGEDDPVLRYFPATDLIDRIPDSEAVQVGGAAHRVILEQARVISSLVDEFLTDADGR